MRHLACLVVGLVLTEACTIGINADTCSTGFLITWAVMTLCVEAGWFLIASEIPT